MQQESAIAGFINDGVIDLLKGKKMANMFQAVLRQGAQELVWDNYILHGQKVKPGFYIYVISFDDKYLINGKLLITN